MSFFLEVELISYLFINYIIFRLGYFDDLTAYQQTVQTLSAELDSPKSSTSASKASTNVSTRIPSSSHQLIFQDVDDSIVVSSRSLRQEAHSICITKPPSTFLLRTVSGQTPGSSPSSKQVQEELMTLEPTQVLSSVEVCGDTSLGSTRLVQISCSSQTGDVAMNVGLLVPNSEATVQQVCSLLADAHELPIHHLQANFAFKAARKTHYISSSVGTDPQPTRFGGPCSVFQALFWHVNLETTPTVSFIRSAAALASRPSEQQTLLNLVRELSSKSKSIPPDLNSVPVPGSVLSLLKSFPSIRMTLADLLALAPINQPRIYTSASSPQIQSKSVSLLVRLVPGGLLSSHLEEETKTNQDYDTLAMYIIPSRFSQLTRTLLPNLPLNSKPIAPVVCIATGSGVAPFRAFLQQIGHIRKQYAHAPIYLFFGCRNTNMDFFFKQEMELAQAEGFLKGLYVAYSRPTPESDSISQYVQDKLQEEQSLIKDLLIQHQGTVMICGSKQMGKHVRNTLMNVLSEKHPNKQNHQDLDVIDDMINQGRYIEETW